MDLTTMTPLGINPESEVHNTDLSPGNVIPGPNPSHFPITGIGASAGGLKALSALLAELPADVGMAFVVIQHLDPIHESVLTSLLARTSPLPIAEAVDRDLVRPNCVYVITPNTDIRIEHGCLHISKRGNEPGPHLSIDIFLRSLAADCPGKSVGIVLSGTGTDGTIGLAAIKAAGGITFAQDETAEHAGMPKSAIGGGHVDFVLSPIEIARELGKLARFGFPTLPLPQEIFCEEAEGLPDPSSLAEDPVSYEAILALLHTSTGIDFTHYRSTTILSLTTVIEGQMPFPDHIA